MGILSSFPMLGNPDKLHPISGRRSKKRKKTRLLVRRGEFGNEKGSRSQLHVPTTRLTDDVTPSIPSKLIVHTDLTLAEYRKDLALVAQQPEFPCKKKGWLPHVPHLPVSRYVRYAAKLRSRESKNQKPKEISYPWWSGCIAPEF